MSQEETWDNLVAMMGNPLRQAITDDMDRIGEDLSFALETFALYPASLRTGEEGAGWVSGTVRVTGRIVPFIEARPQEGQDE